jgi:outer membrane receptor protein involved in Fe transport
VTWSSPWNLDLSLAWRYFGNVTIDYADKNPLIGSTPDTYDKNTKQLSEQNYFDLAAVYTFAEKYTFNFGINNVLDESPPITSSSVAGAPYGNGNTYPQVYDSLGRYVFLGLTAKF